MRDVPVIRDDLGRCLGQVNWSVSIFILGKGFASCTAGFPLIGENFYRDSCSEG